MARIIMAFDGIQPPIKEVVMADPHWKALFQLRAISLKVKTQDMTGSQGEQRVLKAALDNIDEAYSHCLDVANRIGRPVA